MTDTNIINYFKFLQIREINDKMIIAEANK